MSKEDENKPGPEVVGVECFLWCDPPRTHGTKEDPKRGWVTAYDKGPDERAPYQAEGVEGLNFTHARPVYLQDPEDMEERPKRLGSTDDNDDGDLELGEKVEIVGDPGSDRDGQIGIVGRLDKDGNPCIVFDRDFDPDEDDFDDVDGEDWNSFNVEYLRRLKFVKAESKPAPKRGEFKPGEKVRVKDSISRPQHGWGQIKPGDIGVIRRVDGQKLVIDFPKQKGWTGHAPEMEHAEAVPDAPKEDKPTFSVGDRVKINWPGEPSDGKVGTVREVGDDALVQLEDFNGGHSFPGGTGWHVPFGRLTLLNHTTTTTTTTIEKAENTTMGKTLSEQEQTIAVAKIEHFGEQLILPTGMNMDEAIDLLKRRKKYLEEEVQMLESFDVFPWDGAAGFDTVLTRKFGWAPAEATPGFFGPTPPKMIGVEVAPGKTKQVPWGRFSIPGVDGTVNTGVSRKDKRIVFSLQATVKRKDEETIKSLFSELRDYLKDHSIYRGKAIKIRFRNEDGQPLDMPEPKFLETEDIDERMLVYPEATGNAIETNLFTPIRRVQDCLANGIPVKRGVLLGGTYGTGKTLAAKVASKYAVQNGVTYIYIPRADELADAIEFAKQYQSPASVIFCEDIDRVMNGERSVEMDDILNIIDGIDTKSSHILVVLTTNNLKGINPAMMRPGRLDAVIEVLPPDAKAVEKLLRLYGGSAISADIDLAPAAQKLDGKIPAVIAEVVKRAKLAQLRRTPEGQPVTSLTTESLLESAETMSHQLQLLAENSKVEEPLPTLDQALQKMVKEAAVTAVKETVEVKIREIHEHTV